jgi:predicted nucleic-acid-binding protein
MIALDTNVVVRVLTRDDPAQAELAEAAMHADALWLPKTVLLELEWVLRFTYGFERGDICRGLDGLLGLEGLVVEDVDAVARAMEWYQAGMDLADALHLASSPGAEALVTFDRKLASRAVQARTKPRVLLLATDS